MSSRAACRVRPRCSSRQTAGSSSASKAAGCASSRTACFSRLPFVTLDRRLQLASVVCSAWHSTRRSPRIHYVYVYYTATTPTVHNRISRFTANGDVAVAGSEVVIFELDDLSSATNHNGGALAFGPDGKLYAAVGENADGANAQSMNNLLGKMLRLNKDGTIPADNPVLRLGDRQRTARSGRSGCATPSRSRSTPPAPRCSSTTWGRTPGRKSTTASPAPTTAGRRRRDRRPIRSSTSPQIRLQPLEPAACAITGGAFYSPLTRQFPSDYVSDYFFADYCAGWIRKLDPAAGNSVVTFATGISSPVDLKVSDDGSSVLSRARNGSDTGVVLSDRLRRRGADASRPTPSARPSQPGTPVTFSVRASGAPPLRYQWQRNGVNIAGATAAGLHASRPFSPTTARGSGPSSATTPAASPATKPC